MTDIAPMMCGMDDGGLVLIQIIKTKELTIGTKNYAILFISIVMKGTVKYSVLLN